MSTKVKRTSKTKPCKSCLVEGSMYTVPQENGECIEYNNLSNGASTSTTPRTMRSMCRAVPQENGECIEYNNLSNGASTSTTPRTMRTLTREKILALQYGLDYQEELIAVPYNRSRAADNSVDIPSHDNKGFLRSFIPSVSSKHFYLQLIFYCSIFAVCLLLAYHHTHQEKNLGLSYIRRTAADCDTDNNMKQFHCHRHYDDAIRYLTSKIEELKDSNDRLQHAAQVCEQQHNSLKETVLQISTAVEILKIDSHPKRNVEGNAEDESIARLYKEIASYDADKVGLPDFALESSGGNIISTPDTRTVSLNTWFTIWGFTVWRLEKSPRKVIQASVLPGDCWAFHGSSGKVIIELAMPVVIGAITLEHIPSSISLTGNIDSAPRVFTVIGLQESSDREGIGLGYYTYSATGTPRQTFPIVKQDAESAVFFKAVILWILSNHGNPDYTCIYRFRVHGHISAMEEIKSAGDT